VAWARAPGGWFPKSVRPAFTIKTVHGDGIEMGMGMGIGIGIVDSMRMRIEMLCNAVRAQVERVWPDAIQWNGLRLCGVFSTWGGLWFWWLVVCTQAVSAGAGAALCTTPVSMPLLRISCTALHTEYQDSRTAAERTIIGRVRALPGNLLRFIFKEYLPRPACEGALYLRCRIQISITEGPDML